MGAKISLCFICDEIYAMPTVVAITSALIHKVPDDIYDIYVIINNLSDYSVNILKSLGNETVRIIFIDAGNGEKFNQFQMNGYWVTTTDLFKFEIPDLLPAELEKVLYLDGDIIVQKNLAPVFEEDIENVYAGVIKDYFVVSGKDDFRKRLGVQHKAYFNAGILLLNLKKLREDNVSGRLLQYRAGHADKYMDQDTFNVVLQENVKYLSFYYNFQYTCWLCDKQQLAEYYGLEAVNSKYEWIQNAVIIHYTWLKPWQYFDYFAADVWLHYYLLSPYKDIILVRKSLNEMKNAKMEKELGQIIQTVAKQKNEIEKLKKESKKNKAELQKIKQSTGFKLLTKYYRLRDFLSRFNHLKIK